MPHPLVDMRKHKACSKDLIGGLSKKDKSVFDEVMTEGYVLYESALGTVFTG